MAEGLLAIIGKAKPKGGMDKDEMDMGMDKMPMSSGGLEKEYAKEAFAALQDGDESGFVEAFVSAVRACVKKSSSEGYDEAAEE